MENLLQLFHSGGTVMYVLLVCSVVVWTISFERFWRYRLCRKGLAGFHLEAMNVLLRDDSEALRQLCERSQGLPTAKLLLVAVTRLNAKDVNVREKWREALERNRQMMNQDLKQNLWVIGSIASAAPFIGLFGTVLGILQSFHQISETGKGGFAVVAGGISEALVATAAGILVAVMAVLLFNFFQTQWSGLVLTIRLQLEELGEVLGARYVTKYSSHGNYDKA